MTKPIVILVLMTTLATAGACAARGRVEDPQASFGRRVAQSGLKQLVLPRGLFRPGAMVKLRADGTIDGPPIGFIEECSAAAPLTATQGTGPAALFVAQGDQGLRIEVPFIERLIGQPLGLFARSVSHGIIHIPSAYSHLFTQAALSIWLNEQWSRMPAACHALLRSPDTEILTEVFYGGTGTRLSFVQASGIAIGPPTTLLQTLQQGNGALRATADGNSIVFDDALPLLYASYRPTVPVAACPFSNDAVRQARYLDCVRNLAAAARAEIMVEAARALDGSFHTLVERPIVRFQPSDFETATALVDFLYSLDETNGHALYYRSTIRRWMFRDDRLSEDFRRSNDGFLRYLSIEATLPDVEKNGDRPICYERARGYCAERTAWILHSMAVDEWRLSMQTPASERGTHCRRGLDFATRALKTRDSGFDADTQGPSTRELVQKLEAARCSAVE